MEHGPYGIGEYLNHSFCCTIRRRAVWDCGVWLDAVTLEVPISSPYIDCHSPTQTQQHWAPQHWDIFTQLCHTLQDPSALNILLEWSVMTMTAALLLAAKQSTTVFWLRRIAHTTVWDTSELWAHKRALLWVLQWHMTSMPIMGVDSPTLMKALTVCTACTADLAPVLGDVL